MEPHPHSAEGFTSFSVGEQARLNILKKNRRVHVWALLPAHTRLFHSSWSKLLKYSLSPDNLHT